MHRAQVGTKPRVVKKITRSLPSWNLQANLATDDKQAFIHILLRDNDSEKPRRMMSYSIC